MLKNRKLLAFLVLVLLLGTLLLVFWPSPPQFADAPVLLKGTATSHLKDLRPTPNPGPPLAANLSTNLHQMNAREVLALAKQLTGTGRFDGNERALALQLARNWRESLTFAELRAALTDSTNDPKLRAFLVDFLIHAANLTPEESILLDSTLIAIAEITTSDPSLRRYALMALRNQSDDGQTQRIRAIAQHQETPPEVRSAAITAMRRTGDVTGHDAVAREVLTKTEGSPSIVLRHAMVSLAKGGNAAEHTKTFASIATTTDDPQVHASAIYSLGMAKSIEAVMAIIDSAGRHANAPIVRHSLQASEPTILKMLAADQPSAVLESAIDASRMGGLVSAIPLLRLLTDVSATAQVRAKLLQTIEELSKLPVNTNAIRKRYEN